MVRWASISAMVPETLGGSLGEAGPPSPHPLSTNGGADGDRPRAFPEDATQQGRSASPSAGRVWTARGLRGVLR